MEMQSRYRVKNASLHPPALFPDDDNEGAEIPWVLLDQTAYVDQRVNATTAVSETWDGKQIQVTLCLARPPRVSYICVFCRGLPHTVFPLEPKIVAVEEDLLLLRIIVSSSRDIVKDGDYYIYRAADAAMGGGPSLKRLPRPPANYIFGSQQVGILRCGTSHCHDGFILRPHRDDNSGDFYLLAALCKEIFEADPAEFVLCIYNSNCPTSWSTHRISLDQQQRRHYGSEFFHVTSKVISIGGDAGTMGFVDLWRGILFCDVLRVEQGKPAPPLRYVRLPSPHTFNFGDARLARDIAVLQQGRNIKYVELQVHQKPCPTFRGCSVNDGWMSKTWTLPVASGWSEDCWDPGHQRESSHIPVVCNPHFELLPKLLDHRGMPLKPFKGLDISQPTLSLNDDDDGTVYFMTKENHMDDNAWVIAVDMNNNTLQGVAPFSAERSIFVNFAYMHSRISAYLTTAAGTKGNLKRPGMVLLGPYSKKPSFWMSLPPWDEQKQRDSVMEVDGDDISP